MVGVWQLLLWEQRNEYLVHFNTTLASHAAPGLQTIIDWEIFMLKNYLHLEFETRQNLSPVIKIVTRTVHVA